MIDEGAIKAAVNTMVDCGLSRGARLFLWVSSDSMEMSDGAARSIAKSMGYDLTVVREDDTTNIHASAGDEGRRALCRWRKNDGWAEKVVDPQRGACHSQLTTMNHGGVMVWVDFYDRLSFSSSADYRLKSLLPYLDGEVEEGYLDLDPDFQRGRVWTVKQQELFMGHLLSGGTVAPILLSAYGRAATSKRVLLDGKQRLGAIRSFVNDGGFAELYDGRRFRLCDIYDADVMMRAICVKLAEVALSSDPAEARRETLRLYVKLNRGGTPHSDAEIERVQKMLADAEKSVDSE